MGRWEKKVVRYASSFFGFSIRMVWVENERELEDLRERLRLQKAEGEGLINELSEQIDGYHAPNRRLAVELARRAAYPRRGVDPARRPPGRGSRLTCAPVAG